MKLKLLDELKNTSAEAPLNFTFAGVQFKFTAKIKIVDEQTLEELTSKQGANDKEIVRDLLIGWDEFVDEGKQVPFATDTLEEMLAYPGITARLSVECINAQYRVQEKN
ncbi:hypothetical protein [Pseudoalteromonas sp. bablab_jr011]|uniref:hypothetical protein n=1 Tax=Pseudoalteromonas sp. bablab_jr011 TaxID=2755062 RepID=UPI0018F39F00|nr:hypothetical protein [Pseudoalteromonas sp. bablab_jr011]